MFSLCIPTAILCVVLQTPTQWQDSRLDSIDRKALEQLVSFSPPQIPSDATWILPDDSSPAKWSDFLGKVVVVQSWTNSSAKARQIIGVTDKVIAKAKIPKDVVYITVHTPEGLESLKKYHSKHKVPAPTIIDTTGEFCNQLGFYTNPTNFVIDKNGAVRHVGLGTKGLIEAINSLLDESRNIEQIVKQFSPIETTIETRGQYPQYSTSFGKAKNWQGIQAPPFFVEQWLSEPVSVEDRVRVVEFWATWCPPCRKSIPHLNEYARHFKDNVAIVGVSNESKSKVQEFMKKTPMNYGVAIDTKQKMKKTISCSAIPLALVISSDGIVRWQGNPLRLQREIIQQVLSADRGETISSKRGRWEIQETNDQRILSE